MNPFEFVGLPSRAIFGAGKIATLKDEIEALGAQRALFCCSPGRTGTVEKLAAALGPLSAGICAQALPFTPMEAAEEGRRMAAETGADCLVSYGGGNAVGFAKAIALERDIPIIAIATTLSGSETTALQGIIKDGKRVQNASPRMQARTLIYDPELTLPVPLAVLIPSGMNSMAHAVGAMVADNGNPVSRLFAQEGIHAMSAALRRMAKHPEDLDARNSAFYGAWLNANTLKLAPGGVNVHHKLCHVLGGGCGLPHAAVHTVILPHSTAYNSLAVPQAMHGISAALGDETGDTAGSLYDLECEIGAPTALRDIGLPEDALDGVADQVATDSYYSNPRPIERDGIRELLENAWHGNRPQ
jgi:maleylacetate reductase